MLQQRWNLKYIMLSEASQTQKTTEMLCLYKISRKANLLNSKRIGVFLTREVEMVKVKVLAAQLCLTLCGPIWPVAH